jgi:hypothetical protein
MPVSENQKICIVAAVPPPQEGRFAVVTDVGSGMRWTLWLCVDERSLKRKAKSCGSGAPKQALRSRRCSRVLRVTVATKRWSPRRARITRKTIAQGMPVDPALPVVTAACFFCCRRAMGEVVTRHSLRPLFSSRASSRITRADWRRGNADLYPLGSLKFGKLRRVGKGASCAVPTIHSRPGMVGTLPLSPPSYGAS